MATFKNRALTIATVGLLSAAPITIATNGILQIPEAVAPPVEIPVPSQGGGARVGERFVLEYAKRHEHWSALTLELFSQTAFDHVHEIPVAFEHRSTLDLYMWGDGVHHRSGHFFARSNIVVNIESGAKSRQNKVQFLHLTGELSLDSKTYVRFSAADGAHDCTIATPITLHSATRFEHTRVDDVVRPVTHTHVSEYTATFDGEATTLLYRVPIVERAVSHEATSDYSLHLDGEATLAYQTSDAQNYWHRTRFDLTLAPDAAVRAITATRTDVRWVSTLHAALSGTAYAFVTHDVLPHAYDDEEEVLALFAQMMQEFDEG